MILPRQKFSLVVKGKQMYGYDFHRQNRLIDILDFLLRIDAWIEVDGYSHDFWKSMKGWSEGKSDERIGIAVLRFRMNRF
jgi:very-short-patch-repair endonuclease